MYNGILSANGHPTASGAGGGGSGGSINIRATTIIDNLGNTIISANGGDGSQNGGAGSGGRIALYYNTEQFSGKVFASGGGLAGTTHPGGPGTIYHNYDGFKTLEIKNDPLIIKRDIFVDSMESDLGRAAWLIKGASEKYDFDVLVLQNADVGFSGSQISLLS